MYIAELRGKLSKTNVDKEDILTSNVFSFFKYGKRAFFLLRFLREIGVNVTPEQADQAEFLFWPTYEDGTEPDLVMIVGGYYLLFEAKFHSDFQQETREKRAQIDRELQMGSLEAQNYQKQFLYFAVTAHYCQPPGIFDQSPNDLKKYCRWINWQRIATFISKLLDCVDLPIDNETRAFAEDLYSLLDNKNLRVFQGIGSLYHEEIIGHPEYIFFSLKNSSDKMHFSGFDLSEVIKEALIVPLKFIFYNREYNLSAIQSSIKPVDSYIFFEEL